MDCSEVKKLLSAYYDDEMPSERQIAVAKHLERCHECSAELAGFQSLSAMARRLETSTTPAGIWAELERALDKRQSEREEETSKSPSPKSWWLRPTPRLAALAAAILVAVGIGWLGSMAWLGHGEHDEFSAEFGHYLGLFRRDPASAQKFLLAKYESHMVDAQQVAQRLGYRPAASDGLPEGYAIKSTYLIKMPCCTCVQHLCKRSDGSTIAIFEHDDEEVKQWFGDRPEVSAICNGKWCSLVDLDDRLAASWKHDNRYLTVVGVRDLTEVNQLVAWFDEREQAGLP